MIAKIVHTAKQTVKAMVESQSARLWSFLLTVLQFGMAAPVSRQMRVSRWRERCDLAGLV
jgi:hypothetical protein